MTARDSKILQLARDWEATYPDDELKAILGGFTLPVVRFAAYGASNTATPPGGGYSWIPYMDVTKYEHVGGFAHGGYKAAQVAANTTAVDCDVAVVMTGTNDIGPAPYGTDPGVVLNAIRDIVVKSTAPRALVCAIAPRSDDNGREAQRTLEHNERVRRFTLDMGWRWCDPWVTLRAADGTWAHHTNHIGDGIHPTPGSRQRVARDIVPGFRSATWERTTPAT